MDRLFARPAPVFHTLNDRFAFRLTKVNCAAADACFSSQIHAADKAEFSRNRRFAMDSGAIQLIAVAASIVLAAATVAALLWGIWSYKRNAEAQMQLLALGTLQHYLDLAVAYPDLAS